MTRRSMDFDRLMVWPSPSSALFPLQVAVGDALDQSEQGFADVVVAEGLEPAPESRQLGIAFRIRQNGIAQGRWCRQALKK